MKKKLTTQSAFLNLYSLFGLSLLFAGALLALFATSAPARTGPRTAKRPAVTHRATGAIGGDGATCQYTITFANDSIVPGNSDTGSHCTWCDTMINLPFPFVLYDQAFNAVMVNSSGRLDFVCNNEPSGYTETCLPAPPHNCPYDYTIFALWGEWSTTSSATGCSVWANGCGIFTSISGTAPNRVFNIEWHAVRRENDALTANFEVRLYENHPNKRFDVIYGVIQPYPLSFDLTTGGVQGATGFFSQDFCNVPSPQNVSSTYMMLPCSSPTPTPMPTSMVSNTNDSGPGSLRQALADAHNGDTIIFDAALNGRNIGLSSGELVIDKNVTVNGPGANLLGLFGPPNTSSRIFHVMPSTTVTIAGLSISRGVSDQRGGGAILNDHAILTLDSCAVQYSFSAQYSSGGGVYNDGSGASATLAILNSTIRDNGAYYAGGGIYNDASNAGSATLTITNSTIGSNSAIYSAMPYISGGDGGGIFNEGGTLAITNSSVSQNQAGTSDPIPGGSGGGIFNNGTLTIANSSINGNGCALGGGGIASGAAATITSSTVSSNGANGQHDGQPWGYGGGISGNVTFMNSTLSGNYASLSGGGIKGSGVITNSTISGNDGGGIVANGPFEIGDTILKAGTGTNISNNGGTITSHGYNVCSDNGGGFLNGPGDQINTDPILGPLQNNGGPTLTHALLPGSPAIDAGDPSFTPPPLYDQRGPGFDRIFNNHIDVGSFEAQPTPTPTPRCNQYTITQGTGTIVPGTTDTGNHCIWCETLVSLPFPFVLYDQTFTAVYVTSSGRLDFVCHNEPSGYTETCLPVPPYHCPYDFTIFALWHEWSTLTDSPSCSTWANGCGIFTSISGTAPNRIFNIEWHVTRRENTPDTGNFEVRLYENDPDKHFDIIYGAINGVTGVDTAGVQGPTGFFTQDLCNTLALQSTARTYTVLPCASPTPTPAPTARPNISPRTRPTPPPRP